MALNAKLKKTRLTLSASLREMAALLGVSYNSVLMYEQGKRIPLYKTRGEYLKLAKKAEIKLSPEDFDIPNNRSTKTS